MRCVAYGFVEEPETNGVAERWNRTLKEQAIHGRIFQNLKEVRAAVFTSGDLTATDFDELTETCKARHGLASPKPFEPLAVQHLPISGPAIGATISVVSLSHQPQWRKRISIRADGLIRAKSHHRLW